MEETFDSVTSTPITIRSRNNTSISDCPDSFAKWYCLNGATCFSIQVREATLYNCWCTNGFHGLRCDYKYAERRQYHQSVESRPFGDDHRYALAQAASKQGHLLNKSKSTTGTRHHAKEMYIIMYDLLLVFLVFSMIVLILRVLRKKGMVNTMGKRESLRPSRDLEERDTMTRNMAINQDCISIEFETIKRDKGQHPHHNSSYHHVQPSAPKEPQRLQVDDK